MAAMPDPTREPATAADQAFVVALARALHRHGTPAHRLEQALESVTRRIGLHGQFFVLPTSILLSFGPPGAQTVHVVRAAPGSDDLGKLARLDTVLRDVVAGAMTVPEAEHAVAAIESAAPRYGPVSTTLAFAVASACAARFFGGGLREVVAGGLIGLVLGALDRLVARIPRAAPLFEPAAAFVAALLAAVAATVWSPCSAFIATLGGLIVLVPGLTLTVALTELATRHLASGSARLTGAGITFLSIGFGTALGSKVGALLLPTALATPLALPIHTEWLALLLAPLAFAVLLRAERHHVPWIVLAGVLAFQCARLGTRVLGPELGALCGAFAVGVASNLCARLLDRPASVMLVPGILLLVPGSLGVRSLSALAAHDFESGIATAVTMVFVAMALVVGLLVANVVVPPRRSL
jgi:uncharacterized membrane protein YjjP (DUF1212 family)